MENDQESQDEQNPAEQPSPPTQQSPWSKPDYEQPQSQSTPVVTPQQTYQNNLDSTAMSPQPVYSQAQPPQPTNINPEPQANPGVIILQWLTYALWGWTVLAMGALTTTVISYFVSEVDTGDWIIYIVAAVFVLLPIALTLDIFYKRKEPVKKTGASSIVMIIHAVLFALFGIASLITSVFTFISLFTSSGSKETRLIALFSSMIITLLYASVLLRTLNPSSKPWIRKAFLIFIGGVVGIFTVLSFVGPVIGTAKLKTDRLLEDHLSSVNRAIQQYADKNGKLPDSLSDITVKDEAKEIVDRNLVEYKPNTKSASVDSFGSSNSSRLNTTSPNVSKTFYYQLCAEFRKESDRDYYGSYDTTDEYESYQYYSYHTEGTHCFKSKHTTRTSAR